MQYVSAAVLAILFIIVPGSMVLALIYAGYKWWKMKKKDVFIVEGEEVKKTLTCPECHSKLEKIEGTGEGVKHCVDCGCGWFILHTSDPRRKK